ncbi:hypothetical protein HDV62DRAFT_276682 [Trichoderma sp. SZMC 28011]
MQHSPSINLKKRLGLGYFFVFVRLMRYLILNHPYTPQPKCKSLPIQRLYFPVSFFPLPCPKEQKNLRKKGQEAGKKFPRFYKIASRDLVICLFFIPLLFGK